VVIQDYTLNKSLSHVACDHRLKKLGIEGGRTRGEMRGELDESKERTVAYVKRIRELEQHVREQARVLEEWNNFANLEIS